ncbi:MAG: RNA-binding protein [Holosporaceae bacterium]|jgi:RNA recognition motif-containing protein|nr:RNA-binding protein [Holosporaceae bacterium]
MTKKLYIGNLAYSVNDDSLKSAFSAFGEVESAVVIKDKASGRSKGFGFVEMSTDESAAAAIAKMNKTEFSGRMMFVSESHSTDGSRGGGGNSGGGGGGARRFGQNKPDRRPR